MRTRRSSFLADSLPLAAAAASTIAHRLRMLGAMATSPTGARRREAARMVTEKVAAAIEGAAAMQLAGWSEARRWWRDAHRWRWTDAARRVVAAGHAPARRRVLANARRLRRRKRLQLRRGCAA